MWVDGPRVPGVYSSKGSYVLPRLNPGEYVIALKPVDTGIGRLEWRRRSGSLHRSGCIIKKMTQGFSWKGVLFNLKVVSVAFTFMTQLLLFASQVTAT